MAKIHSILASIIAFDTKQNMTNGVLVEFFTKNALADFVLCQRNNRRTVSVAVEIWKKPVGNPMVCTTLIEFTEPKARYVPGPGFHQNHRIVERLPVKN